MPFFSVVIPSYNRAHVICRALQSVLSQSYQDFEIIVVDDGSADQTGEAMKEMLTDSRIRYFYQSNKGVCAARNTGAVMAKGNFLLFLDTDDLVSSTWMEDYYRKINSSNADLLFCAIRKVLPDGEVVIIDPHDPYGNGFDRGNYIPGSFCVSKALFENAGKYDEQIRYGENTELGFRLQKMNPKISFVDLPNLIYQASADGGSKNWKNKLDSNLYILQKHHELFSARKEVKQVFLGVAGVAAVHCRDFALAKKLLFESFCLNVLNLKALVRFLLSVSPMIAEKIWVKK